jgi:hypothetical protein
MATSPVRGLPDFLIIGTQKGGTTSLYSILKTHSDIFLHRRTEIHFFDLNYRRGPAWYRSFYPTYGQATEHRAQTGRELISGEASPLYLFHPDVPARVAAMLPRIRVIALLRNPVDRAYSHYQHSLRSRVEPLSFSKAVASEKARIGTRDAVTSQNKLAFVQHSYVSRGFYVDQIERWYRLIPSNQILVLQSERFFTDPADSLRQVTEFLGTAPFAGLEPSIHGARNVGGYSSKIDPSLRVDLEAMFAPYNERLYRLLGVDWRW